MDRVLLLYCFIAGSLFASGQLPMKSAEWYEGRKEAHCIHFDPSGRAWIATANEMFVDDGETCEPLNIPNTDVQFQFGGIYITTIRPDPDGEHIWVTSWGGGVFRINTINGRVNHWRFDPEYPDQIQTDWTWDVDFIDDRVYICSHYDGIQILDPTTNTFEFRMNEDFPEDKQLGKVRCLQQDIHDSTMYWAATDGGVKKYYPLQDSVVPVPIPKTALRELDHDVEKHNFFYIDQDPDGIVWVGTLAFGLMAYDPAGEHWEQYPLHPEDKNGADLLNFVTDIAIDGDLIALACDDSGVALFNRRTREFDTTNTAFYKASHTNRCLDVHFHKNVLYAPRPVGCIEYKVGPTLPAQAEIPFVKNVSILSSGETYFSSLFQPQKIQLLYGDTLSLELGATGLFDGDIDMDFRWTTKDDWTPVRPFENQEFTFKNSDDYTLEVRYRWNEQAWSEPIELLWLQTSRGIWTYWQSYALVAAAVLLIVWLIISRIRNTLRKQKSMEEQFSRRLAEVQMAALRSQMNPHFLFNSLNSIKDFIVSNQPRDAVKYLQKFSELIRAILENSKEKSISLERELETVKLYADLEALRYGGKFSLDVIIDDQLNPDRMQVPPLVIQPYVENAIWHGLIPKDGNGKITIRCTKEGDQALIQIEDDGIGRKASLKRKQASVMKRKSMGMSITRERIELADGSTNTNSALQIEDLVDHDGNSLGTRINMRLNITLQPV